MRRSVLLSVAPTIWRHGTFLSCVPWLLAWLPASGVEAVLKIGDKVPSFTLNSPAGKTYSLDQTSATALLVFVKINDRNTSKALAELQNLLEKNPELAANLRCFIIVTRMTAGQTLPPHLSSIRAPWQLLIDQKDQTYRDYRIIATPSFIIVGSDRIVAGVHAGYDPGTTQDLRMQLARALKLD